jgi:acyl-CoA thioesterase FadM
VVTPPAGLKDGGERVRDSRPIVRAARPARDFLEHRVIQLRHSDLDTGGHLRAARMLSIADSVLQVSVFSPTERSLETRAIHPWITQLRCDYAQLQPLSGLAVDVGLASEHCDDHSASVTFGFFHGRALRVSYAYLSLRLQFVSDTSQQPVSVPPDVARRLRQYRWRARASSSIR